jgi:hypothetical protein
VNLYVDGAVVPEDGANGWTLVGTKLTLEGATCASVENGTALSIHVEQGCPTVH